MERPFFTENFKCFLGQLELVFFSKCEVYSLLVLRKKGWYEN